VKFRYSVARVFTYVKKYFFKYSVTYIGDPRYIIISNGSPLVLAVQPASWKFQSRTCSTCRLPVV